MRRLAIGIFFALACSGSAIASPPTATVAQGALAGSMESSVAVFKGIPYAAPPTGDLRWRPPQAPADWQGTREAAAYGAICPQAPQRMARDLKQSEDCLTLNVWSPDMTAAKKLPVMVWIYGGGFRSGGSAFPYYDGTELAKHGVVVVSFNYRLGWLGFFDHPALATENAGEATGNYGLMDQIAALRWVRDNIASFGGDPANVTIFGESAGAMSVNDLMVSPAARGLFEKAISESGLGLTLIATKEMAQDAAKAFAAREHVTGTGAAALTAMRKLPVAAILADQKDVPLDKATTPMVDGTILPAQPSVLFAHGKIAHAAYLTGTNSNEATLMKWLSGGPKAMLARFGDRLPEVRKLYDSVEGRTLSDEELSRQIFDDSVFAAGAQGLAHFAARVGEPAYVYYFDYVADARRSKESGVGHGGEIPFVFGLGGIEKSPALASLMLRGITGKDRSIIAMMQAYWTNFAKTGNPEGEGLPQWPQVTEVQTPTLVIDDHTHAVETFHARRIAIAYDGWSKTTGIPMAP